MADPQLNLQVTADITALQGGMAKATTIVDGATKQMSSAVEKMSIAQRLDAQLQGVERMGKRINVAMGLTRAAAVAATGDIEGALAALPGPFGQVAGAAFSLGGALHEAFTGAKAALAEAAEEMKKLETRTGFKAQARDAERLLEIEMESDPIRKLELERQNALALARRQARQAASEGAGQEAAAAAAAQERVINAQFDNKIRDANLQLAKEQADIDKKAKDTADANAKIAHDAMVAREKAIGQGAIMIEDAQMEAAIAAAADDAARSRLELEKDLRDIERDRLQNIETMGEEMANRVADAQKESRLTKEQVRLEDQLKEKQKELADLQKEQVGGSRVSSVDFGFGGPMLVATHGAQQTTAAASEKAVQLQGTIAKLVDQIARNTTNLGSMGIK